MLRTKTEPWSHEKSPPPLIHKPGNGFLALRCQSLPHPNKALTLEQLPMNHWCQCPWKNVIRQSYWPYIHCGHPLCAYIIKVQVTKSWPAPSRKKCNQRSWSQQLHNYFFVLGIWTQNLIYGFLFCFVWGFVSLFFVFLTRSHSIALVGLELTSSCPSLLTSWYYRNVPPYLANNYSNTQCKLNEPWIQTCFASSVDNKIPFKQCC